MRRAARFRKWLTVTGAVLMLLLFAAFALAYRSVQHVDDLNALVSHTQEVIREADNLRVARASLRNSYFAFREDRDEKWAQAFETRKQALEERLDRLRSLTSDNEQQRRRLEEIAPALSSEAEGLEKALRVGETAMRDGQLLPRGLPAVIGPNDPIREKIDEFENAEAGLFRSRSLEVARNAHLALKSLLVTGILTIVILVFSGHLIQREIMKRAKVEAGLRRAQEILGVRLEEQRSELDHAVDDLHAQILARKSAEENLSRLNMELEERVETRTAELRELNRELEAFTYSVSHDLRAPLRHMDSFSRILQQEFGPQLSDEAMHYLDRVRTAAIHMSGLVEDLLNLSRIGRRPPRRQNVSPQLLAEEARQELLPEAQGREITWKMGKIPDVEADPGLLRQVFVNLFSNAMKFTRNNQDAVIEVWSCHESGKLRISVKDNGAGFDPRYADKLFGVFQRLHRQDEFEGTGIGLATVQRIIHKHGGRVWAESQVGKGATFHFTIPAASKSVATAPETIGART